MKIEKLKPGMVVYDVGRHKMGNTTISTVAVWEVRIISVDVASGIVQAIWNSNDAQTYRQHQITRWRAKRPTLIRSGLGNYRLATRAELKAAQGGQGE